jgi:hypothetical protein
MAYHQRLKLEDSSYLKVNEDNVEGEVDVLDIMPYLEYGIMFRYQPLHFIFCVVNILMAFEM